MQKSFIAHAIVVLGLVCFYFDPAKAKSGNNFESVPLAQWTLALHYKTAWGRHTQGTRATGFYLSSQADPHAELLANLKAAQTDPTYVCRFPFRAKLLVRQGLWTPGDTSCGKLLAWKSAFDRHQVSLAFASQYMTNPASVFGHTFLVFSPDRTAKHSPHPSFLDTTIGYAADMPPKVGPLRYVVGGLGGWFKGKFFDEPLYQRVHEYADMELRDLWFYPMRLSTEQIDDLLDHIYELTQSNFFDYFFIDENCSHMLLKVIAAVTAEEGLFDSFSIYVLPHETIKALKRRRLLEAGVLLPSTRAQFLQTYATLSSHDQRVLHQALAGDVGGRGSAAVYDALIDYLEMRKVAQRGHIDAAQQQLYQTVLLRRSQLGPRAPVAVANGLDPSESQNPHALALSQGLLNGRGFQQLEFRPAAHSLLDTNHAYIKHSEMRFLSPTLRREETEGLALERFTLLSLANFVPYRPIDPIYSWVFRAESDKTRDGFCPRCRVERLRFGAGLTLSVMPELDLFVLPLFQSEWSTEFTGAARAGAGVSAGAIVNFHERLKMLASYEDRFADRWGQWRSRLHTANLEARYNFSASYGLQLSHEHVVTTPSTRSWNQSALSGLYFF